MSKKQTENFTSRNKSLAEDLVPVFLPKGLVATLVKNYVPESLQKSLSSMSKKEIMNRLHKTRKKILMQNPNNYIDYNS
jgi:hypothetical protein